MKLCINWADVQAMTTNTGKAVVVVSVEEEEDDMCFQLFYKRFEDSNLIVCKDDIKTEKIIGQGMHLIPKIERKRNAVGQAWASCSRYMSH